jgi:hypothetical protein
MQLRNHQCSCEIAWQGRHGQAYNEEAFRYLLAAERTRSQRSGRPLILVLVVIGRTDRRRGPVNAAVAAQVLGSLVRCFRQTDVVGWYRGDRVAAALLTDLGSGYRPDVSHLIHRRVTDTLSQRLPADVPRRLHIRVYPTNPEPSC